MLDIELFALLDGVLRGWSDAPSEVLARLERKPDRWIYELYRDFRSCLIKLPKPETRPAGQLWTYREIGPGTDPIEPLASVLYSHHLVLNIPQWDIYPSGYGGDTEFLEYLLRASSDANTPMAALGTLDPLLDEIDEHYKAEMAMLLSNHFTVEAVRKRLWLYLILFSHLREPVERGWVSFWTANVDPRIVQDLRYEVPLFSRALLRAIYGSEVSIHWQWLHRDAFDGRALKYIHQVLKGYKLSQQVGRVCLVSKDSKLSAIAEAFYTYFSNIDDERTPWRPSEQYAARLEHLLERLGPVEHMDLGIVKELSDLGVPPQGHIKPVEKDVRKDHPIANRALLADRLLFPLPMPGWLDTQSLVRLRTDDDAFTAWLDRLRETVSRLATAHQASELQEAIDEERAALADRARVVRQKVQEAPNSVYRKAGFQAMVTSAVTVTGTLAVLPGSPISTLLASSLVAGAGAGLAALAELRDVPLQGADLSRLARGSVRNWGEGGPLTR